MAAILIVAHAPLASALKAVAAHVYPDESQVVEALDVNPDTEPELAEAQAQGLLERGAENEWLVLVDVFGATPCNAALRLADPTRRGSRAAEVRVVAGVNVPMLWRVLCYAGEPLDALVARAMAGATDGIMEPAAQRPREHHPNTSLCAEDDRSDQ